MNAAALPFDAAPLLAILAPMVIVPLGVITFYLRALRDHQLAGQSELTRRIEHVEGGLRRVSTRVTDMERDYATKEDWLRESMLARANLERLAEGLARLDGAHAAGRTPARRGGTRAYEGTD